MTDNGVFEAILKIREKDKSDGIRPLFFANVGDLHYAGSTSSSNRDFQWGYHEAFKSPDQRKFYE
jgi:hypothetical protein